MRPGFRTIYRLIEVLPSRVSEFQERTHGRVGIYFPAEYIRRADAYALVDQANDICGGLIIANQLPFRSLQSIPAQVKRDAEEKLGCLDECAEVNGVWISPAYKSAFISIAFWRQITEILLKCRKQTFLFTVDHSNSHMLAQVAAFKPKVLYSGETVRLDGMNDVAHEAILSIHRESLEELVSLLNRTNKGQQQPDDLEIFHQIAMRREMRATFAAYDRTKR